MKLFLTLSKKKLIIILAILIISLVLLSQLFSIKAYGIDGSTNASRCEYISSLGLKIDETAVSSKNITIPEEFSKVYIEYNLIQKEADFDLTVYKGKPATVYTYRLKDSEDMFVNIIVSNGEIIGGDISSVKLGGEMRPLKKQIRKENV